MSAPNARVLRQGEESIVPASELVVGDIVLIDDGAMVPADLRLIESANLKIQEASLTGESVPSEKDAKDIMPQECVLGDRVNMAYTSSIVTYGHGTGVVVATGMNTEVGNIAGLLENQDELDTPLKRKLNAVGKTLTVVGIIVCALIFAIGSGNFHYPGGAACHGYHCYGSGRPENGKAERLNPEAACGGDAGKRNGNLQR